MCRARRTPMTLRQVRLLEYEICFLRCAKRLNLATATGEDSVFSGSSDSECATC
jgi:hypothetical protein